MRKPAPIITPALVRPNNIIMMKMDKLGINRPSGESRREHVTSPGLDV